MAHTKHKFFSANTMSVAVCVYEAKDYIRNIRIKECMLNIHDT